MSSNNKETFQWNEKLVEDLATSMYPEEFRQAIINHIAKFKLFKAPAPKQPLFTTSDGKDVYEGDRFWFVWIKQPAKGHSLNEVYSSIGEACNSDDSYSTEYAKYFSSEAAAKEYILLNKPVLSVNDIKEVGELAQCAGSKMVLISFEKLEAFAKSKIDKP